MYEGRGHTQCDSEVRQLNKETDASGCKREWTKSPRQTLAETHST